MNHAKWAILGALVLTSSAVGAQSNRQAPNTCSAPNQTEESVSETAGDVAQPFTLLQQKVVQEELKLSDEQVKKLPEFRLSFYKRTSHLRSTPPQDLEARRLARREMSDMLAKELKGFLSADQYQRFQQIILQANAADGWGLVTVFRNPAVAREMNLTDQQKEQIASIRKEIQDSYSKLLGGGREERVKRMAELRKSNNDRIERMLTEKQLAKWKEMIGPELKAKVYLRDQ